MQTKRILSVGSVNMDFLLTMNYVPLAGQTVMEDGRYNFVPGGKGANTAVAAARLGGRVSLCARVGNDVNGEKLLKVYNQEGLDIRHVKTDKLSQTGLAVVMLEKSGQNRIIVYPGANLNLNSTDVESAFTVYPDAVLTQFEISDDALLVTAKKALEHKALFVLDGGAVRRDFPLSELGHVDIFSPNEYETELITGIRPNTIENCLRASIALCNTVDIGYVVLKLGSRGAYLYDGKYCDMFMPFNVAPIDTTAAGDAFTAALCVEYMRTGSIYDSIKYANAAGALTVTKVGAINSLPTDDEVRKLIKRSLI